MDKFISGQFQNFANPKDGFAIVDFKDVKAKQELEFLIPIFYAKKPT